jgi:AcrR family transcriptional regulator
MDISFVWIERGSNQLLNYPSTYDLIYSIAFWDIAMPRTAGARNQDYEDARKAMILKAQPLLSAKAGPAPSLRDLAAAAGVSVTTFRHYFRSRQEFVAAVFAVARVVGASHIDRGRQPSSTELAPSLRAFLAGVARAWADGSVGALHRIGLTEGLRDGASGLRYLEDVLEPTLQSLEHRLAQHIEQGTMRAAETRHAALMLLSPLVLALLHQHDLGGTRCRPLDIASVIDAQVEVFCRAFGIAAATPTVRQTVSPAS